MATEERNLQKLFEESKKELNVYSGPVAKDVAMQNQPSVDLVIEDSDNLTRIVQTREQIAQVKKNLSTIIDSIVDNPSLVTRASDAWGTWPIWQKVGTGLVLTVPALLAGVATSLGSLLIIGGATGVVYTTTGMILEDHHSCNVNIKQRLKEGILSIADVLELTIVALDNIRFKLAEEISKFKNENLKLTAQVSTLNDQIHTLSIQIGILVEMDQYLCTAKEVIQFQIEDLKNSTEAQSELLQKKQEELAAAVKDYKMNQELLIARVEELRAVRESMTQEVEQTKKISEALQKAVTALSEQVLEDQAQKEAFQLKLQSLLTEENTSVLKVLERMSTTKLELEEAQADLNDNNERNRKLLDKQDELVGRLEQLDLSGVEKFDKEAKVSVVGQSMFSAHSTKMYFLQSNTVKVSGNNSMPTVN